MLPQYFDSPMQTTSYHLALISQYLFHVKMKIFPLVILSLSLLLGSCFDIFEDIKEEEKETIGDSAIDRQKKLEELEFRVKILEWENSRLSLKMNTVDGSSLVKDKSTGLWHYDVQRNPFTGRAFETFPNGSPRGEADFLNGRKDGLERFWWTNGKLKEEAQWFDGRPNGVFRQWDEKGELSNVVRYKNGQLIEVILDNR